MFLILVIHADYVALPHVEYGDLLYNTVPSITRLYIYSISVVAVNVFVFISGWFLVNARKKSVLSFVYLIIWWLWGGHFCFIYWENFPSPSMAY